VIVGEWWEVVGEGQLESVQGEAGVGLEGCKRAKQRVGASTEGRWGAELDIEAFGVVGPNSGRLVLVGIEVEKVGIEAVRAGIEAVRVGIEVVRVGIEAEREGTEAVRVGIVERLGELSSDLLVRLDTVVLPEMWGTVVLLEMVALSNEEMWLGMTGAVAVYQEYRMLVIGVHPVGEYHTAVYCTPVWTVVRAAQVLLRRTFVVVGRKDVVVAALD
jgi:hypothetical protein